MVKGGRIFGFDQACLGRDCDAMSRLVGKLKVLKWAVTDWEHRMKHDRCSELVSIETTIANLFLLAPTRILSYEDTELLLELKACKEKLLAFEASTWRLKSWAVWI